jgi:excisionase family DNA binding protein
MEAEGAMPQTSKSRKATSQNHAPSEVMDLAAAAKFLRLPAKTVVRLVKEQGLPGRQIGKQWRFLRAAIERWLEPAKDRGGSIFDHAGVWANDPAFEEYQKIIAENRKRWDEEVA